jgi:transcriptional regulator with XRE-family HTH domain
MITKPHYLREWRKHRGLTQAALAAAMGIDRTLICKTETYKLRYNQDLLEAAARVLQCTPAELLVRDPNDPHGLWAELERMTAEEQATAGRMLRALRQAS